MIAEFLGMTIGPIVGMFDTWINTGIGLIKGVIGMFGE